eukprot:6212860-Lingulodinium_polyedra.AAC.1
MAPRFTRRVAEKARGNAAIFKEFRKHNEELMLRRPGEPYPSQGATGRRPRAPRRRGPQGRPPR